MEKLSILDVTRSDYKATNTTASCSHCGNCGGQTGCGAKCRGGKTSGEN